MSRAHDPNQPAPQAWTPPASALLKQRVEGLGLVLRRYEPSDAPQLWSVVDDGRAALLPWAPWANNYTSPERCVEILGDLIAAWDRPLETISAGISGYVLAIFDPASGDLLVGTGIARINAAALTGECGYWVRADRRNQGIATRATRLCLSWAFTPQAQGGLGLRRVHFFAGETNAPSLAVLDGLGLHRTTHTREDRWIEGQGWIGTRGWDVLAHEWDHANHTLRADPTTPRRS